MDFVVLTGMVIKVSDVSEYDKRLVILTKERGKIVAFAKGAKRTKNTLMAASRLFAFGEFTLYEGKDSYSLNKADIKNYFTDISNDVDAMCYGCYFLEFADYYSRENVESTETLKLLYQTLRALLNENIPNRLIKCVFELKMLTINGEYPNVFECAFCKSKDVESFSALKSGVVCRGCVSKISDVVNVETSTVYTMQFIISTSIEKLYTFVVKENVLSEFEFILRRYLNIHIEKEFNSLKILNTILK